MDKTLSLALVPPAAKPPVMDFVLIPAGSFVMGSPPGEKDRCDDESQYEVVLTKSFYMGKFPVTQAQYEAVMGVNPSHFHGECCADSANNPVELVSWDDAQEFCKRLSKSAGKPVRLPTEAEWEYACRAGSNTAFCFGDDESKLGEYAWHYINSGGKTHPVGQKCPNAYGLHDMHGNVWEWCQDWYGNYLAQGAKAKPAKNPTGPATGARRVLRGGSWGNDPWGCRSARRDGGGPDFRFYRIGFRVVVVPSFRTSV